MNLTKKIKEYCHKIGFELVAIVPAEKAQTVGFYEDWLSKGFNGEMDYLKRHLEKKREPASLLDGARSIICLGINYFTTDIPDSRKKDCSLGIISRYAWGLDYHEVIKQKLEDLHSFIEFVFRSNIKAKICVDTVPILEREFANRAGIGWIGKNCNLINREYGSYIFLAELIIDKDLIYDDIEIKERCGTCTRCIDACPTGALLSPRTLDSRKCISYLTLEYKGIIPREFRKAIGNRIFGCDICQEVCPWNRNTKPTKEKDFFPRKMRTTPNLQDLMLLSDNEFRNLFKNSPIKRIKRQRFLRNVAIAIGNSSEPLFISTLIEALKDNEPLVRVHVAWALGEYKSTKVKDALVSAHSKETEPEVIKEINFSLKQQNN